MRVSARGERADSRRPVPPHFRERSSHARSARGSALTCTGGEHAPFETALLLLLSSRARGRRFGRDLGLPCPWSLLVSQQLLLDTLPRLRASTRRTPPIASCIQRLHLDANAVDRSAARPMAKRRGPRPNARASCCPERQLRTCCRRPAPVGWLIPTAPASSAGRRRARARGSLVHGSLSCSRRTLLARSGVRFPTRTASMSRRCGRFRSFALRSRPTRIPSAR